MSERRTRDDAASMVPEAGSPALQVDDGPVCGVFVHVWPVDFSYGDPCNCGAMYLLQRPDGRPCVEVRSV